MWPLWLLQRYVLTMQSKTTATGMILNPDTPEAHLVVEIKVECPECGTATIRIPGHHLRVVRDIAASYCDAHPELTKSDITLVSSHQFDGVMPKNPENN